MNVAFIGDTVCWADKMVDPLPGFKPMKAMVCGPRVWRSETS
jgi:translation elongation factor EF-4